MATTRDEAATTKANTISVCEVASVVGWCDWHFADIIGDLENSVRKKKRECGIRRGDRLLDDEEEEYLSKLRSCKDSFESWKKGSRAYDKGYEGLDQRLKRQPSFHYSYELALHMIKWNLYSMVLDFENVTSSEGKVKNMGLRLIFIEHKIKKLHLLHYDIWTAAKPWLQYRVEVDLEGSMYRERFEVNAANALLHLYPRILRPFLYRLQKSMGLQYERLLNWKTHARGVQRNSLQSFNIELQQDEHSKDGSTPAFVQFDKILKRYPNPPQCEGEEDKKPCPLCQKMFSKSDYDNRWWWRYHVNQDLLPFVCISPGCSDFPCYATESEWVVHMMDAHSGLLLQMELEFNGGTSAPDRRQPLKTCLICAPRKTGDSSGNCNGPQAAAATENLHKNPLASDRELKILKHGAMLIHIANHLNLLGLLAMEMSEDTIPAEINTKMISQTAVNSFDNESDVLVRDNPEESLADVVSHEEEPVAHTMGALLIDKETELERKDTLERPLGNKNMLLDEMRQIRLEYDDFLEKALNIHAGGRLFDPLLDTATAFRRLRSQVPRRIGEPNTFTSKDLYDFFYGLFATIIPRDKDGHIYFLYGPYGRKNYGQEDGVAHYCFDQIWTDRRYRDTRTLTGEAFASRRKIFSVLLIHKVPVAILKFIKQGITDFHIPISEDSLRQMFPTWTDGFIDSFLMIQSQHIFTVPRAEKVLRRNQYKIAWICDTPTQYLAARTFLDEEHSLPEDVPQYDSVVFSLGTIAGNNVVIAASLYRGHITLTARYVMSEVLLYFPRIKASLSVGVGGGMPSPRHDIRLGDVVVGTTQTGQNSVFEYDCDYSVQERTFQDIYFMNQLPELLQKAVASLNPTYGSTSYDYDLYKGEGEILQRDHESTS